LKKLLSFIQSKRRTDERADNCGCTSATFESNIFFDKLNITDTVCNLGVGLSSNGKQVSGKI
jgi:hypothetical protein